MVHDAFRELSMDKVTNFVNRCGQEIGQHKKFNMDKKKSSKQGSAAGKIMVLTCLTMSINFIPQRID